LKGRTP